MITYKINGIKYPFPTRWEDVTYSQYVAMIRAQSVVDQLHIFTGIPRETLEKAELKNLEKVMITLSFMSFSPKFEKTRLVGPYFVPEDVTIQSTGQFEDLRALLNKVPKELNSLETAEVMADLYLHACAIYCQKLKDGQYDPNKVPAMKEELKQYSCAQICGTGGFFLFRPLTLSAPTMNRFRMFTQRLKRWSQGLPGYQKTLDLLQPSPESRGK
jgi:hypothetical protein